jgi:hypothetical protein
MSRRILIQAVETKFPVQRWAVRGSYIFKSLFSSVKHSKQLWFSLPQRR